MTDLVDAFRQVFGDPPPWRLPYVEPVERDVDDTDPLGREADLAALRQFGA